MEHNCLWWNFTPGTKFPFFNTYPEKLCWMFKTVLVHKVHLSSHSNTCNHGHSWQTMEENTALTDLQTDWLCYVFVYVLCVHVHWVPGRVACRLKVSPVKIRWMMMMMMMLLTGPNHLRMPIWPFLAGVAGVSKTALHYSTSKLKRPAQSIPSRWTNN